MIPRRLVFYLQATGVCICIHTHGADMLFIISSSCEIVSGIIEDIIILASVRPQYDKSKKRSSVRTVVSRQAGPEFNSNTICSGNKKMKTPIQLCFYHNFQRHCSGKRNHAGFGAYFGLCCLMICTFNTLVYPVVSLFRNYSTCVLNMC